MAINIEPTKYFQGQNGILGKKKDWKRVLLKDIIEIQKGLAFRSKYFSDSQGYPIIRIRDLLKNKTETYYNGKYDPSYIVKKGDLLVGMDGDFNHTIWHGEDSLLNQRICRIKHNPQFINKKFLFYGLGGYLKAINDNTSSVTVKHLSTKSIKEIPFPLPPIKDQKRIVLKLDSIFDKLNITKISMQNIHDKISIFKKSFLKSIYLKKNNCKKEGKSFSNEFGFSNLPSFKAISHWEQAKVKQLFKVISGATPRRDNLSYWDQGTIPWIKSGAVQNCNITVAQEFITAKALEETYCKLIPKNSLLIAMYGEGKTRGQVGILKIKSTINQAMAALINENFPEYIIEFIFYFLLFQSDKIRSMASGGAQLNINTKLIKNWTLPLPPIEEIKYITKHIKSVFKQLNSIEHKIKIIEDKICYIDKIALKKAFEGHF